MGEIRMAMGGRPKEEGGHKRLKISLCMSIYVYLGGIKNRSKFLEELIRKYAAHTKDELLPKYKPVFPSSGFGIIALEPTYNS